MAELLPLVLVVGSVADWQLTGNNSYPAMDETLKVLRSYANLSGSTVTVATENHSEGIRSYCEGSSSSAPPWTTYYASLFDTTVTWNGTTGGPVNAGKLGTWELHAWNVGGDQTWTNTDFTPPSHMRMRIDRYNPHVNYFEVPAGGGGGGG